MGSDERPDSMVARKAFLRSLWGVSLEGGESLGGAIVLSNYIFEMRRQVCKCR